MLPQTRANIQELICMQNDYGDQDIRETSIHHTLPELKINIVCQQQERIANGKRTDFGAESGSGSGSHSLVALTRGSAELQESAHGVSKNSVFISQ